MSAEMKELAAYVLEFLESRNGGELREVFDNMTRKDYSLLLEQLSMILEHGGKPPNWIK